MKTLGSAQFVVNVTGTSSGAGGVVVITTASAHGLATGNKVLIDGVQGTTEANGYWTITNLTSTTFSLNGSTYANTYTSGSGRVYKRSTLRLKATGTITTPLFVSISTTNYVGGVRSGVIGLMVSIPNTTAVEILPQLVDITQDLEMISIKNMNSGSVDIVLEVLHFDGSVQEVQRLAAIAQYELGSWRRGSPNIDDPTGASRTQSLPPVGGP